MKEEENITQKMKCSREANTVDKIVYARILVLFLRLENAYEKTVWCQSEVLNDEETARRNENARPTRYAQRVTRSSACCPLFHRQPQDSDLSAFNGCS